MGSGPKELTSRSDGRGNDRRGQALHQYIAGRVNGLELADMQGILPRMDEWLRRGIGMVIWEQWERTGTKLGGLVKPGVDRPKAWEWASTWKGYWHTVNSFIPNTTMTTDRIRHAGYLSLLDQYRKVRTRT